MSRDAAEKHTVDLKRFIPFLERMIAGLTEAEDEGKRAQKRKFQSLLSVITSKDTRLKPETQERCEEVLRKLYGKFGKDCDLGASSTSPRKVYIANGPEAVHLSRTLDRAQDNFRLSQPQGAQPTEGRAYVATETASPSSPLPHTMVQSVPHHHTRGFGRHAVGQQATSTRSKASKHLEDSRGHDADTYRDDACWQRDVLSFHVPVHFDFEQSASLRHPVSPVVRKAENAISVVSPSPAADCAGRSPTTFAHSSRVERSHSRQVESRNSVAPESRVDGISVVAGFHSVNGVSKRELISERYQPYPLVDYRHGLRHSGSGEVHQRSCETESRPQSMRTRESSVCSQEEVQRKDFQSQNMNRPHSEPQRSLFVQASNHSSRFPIKELSFTHSSTTASQRFVKAASVRPFLISQKPSTLEHPKMHEGTCSIPNASLLLDNPPAVMVRASRRLDPRLQRRNPATMRSADVFGIGPAKSNDDLTRAQPAPTTEVTRNKPSDTSETFKSPLESLYSGSTSLRTGLGYGPQKFKKNAVVHAEKLGENNRQNSVVEGPVAALKRTAPNPVDIKPEESSSNGTGNKLNEPGMGVPLDIIESYLKKVLPLEEAQKVVDRVRCLEKSKAEVIETDGTGNDGFRSAKTHQGCVTGAITASVRGTATEDSSYLNNPSGLSTVHQANGDSLILTEGPSALNSREAAKALCLRGAGSSGKKNSVPLSEVQSLHEESIKFLAGTELLQGRRPRRRNVSHKLEPSHTAGNAQKGRPVQPKRKTKVLHEEQGLHNARADESDVLRDTTETSNAYPMVKIYVDGNYFSATERDMSDPLEDKEISVSVDAKLPSGSSEESSSILQSDLVQSHLTMHGNCNRDLESVHQDCASLPDPKCAHDVLSLKTAEIMVISEPQDRARCGECTFVGHNILEHYVNHHPGVSNPYAVIPKEKWDFLKKLPLGPPSRYSHTSTLNLDCGWIPAGPSYFVPLACKLCSFTSSLRTELQEHYLLHGFDHSCKYRCLVCDTEEDNFFQMYDHLTLHTGEYRYRCGYCNHRVGRKCEMKSHMDKFHSLQNQSLFCIESLDHAGFWAYAFVCCNCRYFQLSEDNLITHVSSDSRCQSYCQVNVFSLVFNSDDKDSTHSPSAEATSQDTDFESLVDRCLQLKVWCVDRPWQSQFAIELLEKLEMSRGGEVNGNSVPRLKIPCRRHAPGVAAPVPTFEYQTPDLETIILGKNFRKILEVTIGKLTERVCWGDPASTELGNEHLAGANSETTSEALTEQGDMFLRVADVVSLHPFEERQNWSGSSEKTRPVSEEDEHDCQILESVSLNTTLNMVVLLTEECCFPFRILHDRIRFVEEKKEPQVFSLMMMTENVTNLFKCVAFNCAFSSNSSVAFRSHLRDHAEHYHQTACEPSETQCANGEIVSAPDFYLCSYCPFVGKSDENLLLHILSSHNVQYWYQCSACFFRGASALHAEYHVLRHHTGQSGISVLPCTGLHALGSEGSAQTIELSDLPRYVCSTVHCNLQFVTHDAYCRHVKLSHPGMDHVTCNYCDHLATPEDLFDHSVVHGLGAFQCLYCAYGTNSVESVLDHVCLVHADQAVKVFWRREGCGRPEAPCIPRDSQHNALKEILKVVCTSAEFILIGTTAAEPGISINFAAVEGFEGSVRSIRRDLKTPIDALMVTSISSTTSTDGIPYSSPSSASNLTGLAGHGLYKCGNIGCQFSAPDSGELKEHLCVCDLARDSELLICYHCSKPQKTIAHLIDHLKTHGLKPYSCGLCGKCFESLSRATWHVKKTHHSPGSCVSRATGGTRDSDFIVYPKAALKTLADLESLENLNTEQQKFMPEDVASIPLKEVFPMDMFCAGCSFSTKVRSNLVKHLKLHQEGAEKLGILPDSSPINPVPHLSHGTKLFHKTNNLTACAQGVKSSVSNSQLNFPNTSPVVGFIPASKRYICGVTGCLFFGNNEDQLMTHVLQHKSDLFDCPHCPAEKKTFSHAEFLFHLRLHGPCVYGCPHCPFLHWKRSTAEQHIVGAHPGLKQTELVFRESKDDLLPSTDKTQEGERWRCTLCRHVINSASEAASHVLNQHRVREQFRCVLCPEYFSAKDAVLNHYGSAHPLGKMEVLVLFHRIPCKRPSSDKLNEIVPLWKRRKDGPQQIRGIPIADGTEDVLQKLVKEAVPEELVEVAVPEELVEVTVPEELVEVAVPEELVEVAVPEELVEVAVPEELVEVAVPEELVEVAAPEELVEVAVELVEVAVELVEVAVPEELVEVAVPEELVEVAVPEELVEVAVPEELVEVAVPEELVEVAVPEELVEVAVPEELVEVAVPEKSVRSSAASDVTALPIDPPAPQRQEENEQMYGPVGKPVGSRFCCPLCSNFRASRNNRYSFRLHLYSDLNYKRFKCSLCNKKYSSQSIGRHVKEVHRNQNAQIVQLPSNRAIELWVENVINSQAKMMTHSRKAKQTETSEGDSGATTTSALLEERTAPPTFVTFSCHLCDFVCNLESEIVAHRTSHPEHKLTYRTDALPSSNLRTQYDNVIKYACPLCPGRFSTWLSVQEHFKRHPDVVQCGTCHHLSATPEGIVVHWKKCHGIDKDCVFAPVGENLLNYVSVLTVRIPSGGNSNSSSGDHREDQTRAVTELEEVATIVPGKLGHTKDERRTTKRAAASPANCEEEFSFYGKKPEFVDLKNIYTVLNRNGSSSKRVTVATLAKKMTLFPKVSLKDCCK